MKRAWLIAIAVAALFQVAVVVMISSPPAPPIGRWQPTAPIAVSTLPPLARDAAWPRGPAVIYFWATWCEPCVRHLPETLALAASSATPVWLVARDASWDAVVRHFEGAVPATVVHDQGLGAALGVHVLPTTFYIDDDHVRARSLDMLSRTLIERAP